MKKPHVGVSIIGVSLSLITSANAGLIFSDSFGYPNGSLVGQGGWTETSGGGVNPIQVNNERVSLAGAGQDAGHALTVPNTPGTSFYIGMDVKLSVAKDAGDYFLHVTSGSGFYDRLWAKKNDSSTFFLGLSPGGSATPTYGTTPLSQGQDYRIVIAHSFGGSADALALFVNPSGPGDTPYASASGGALAAAVSAINLRQGDGAKAPTFELDNLAVTDNFLEAVPEPSTYLAGCFSAGLLAMTFRARNARSMSGKA